MHVVCVSLSLSFDQFLVTVDDLKPGVKAISEVFSTQATELGFSAFVLQFYICVLRNIFSIFEFPVNLFFFLFQYSLALFAISPFSNCLSSRWGQRNS